jgi:hypothetical protein
MDIFKNKLLEFIMRCHPYMTKDKIKLKAVIEMRADLAAEAYENAVKIGYRSFEAMEIAEKKLYQGLNFSPMETLSNIVEELGWETWTEEQIVDLYFQTDNIFSKYELSSDNFENTPEAEQLNNELKEYIELNGILEVTAS